jgi:hypothetical protein
MVGQNELRLLSGMTSGASFFRKGFSFGNGKTR